MRHLKLAAILEEIADLLEIKGENPYKIRAYRRGAQAIALLPIDIREVVQHGQLDSIPGIGKALAAKVQEWLETGKIAYHEELVAEVPRGLLDVMRVPGIGPRLAKRLYDEIGVASLEDLAQAVRARKLRTVRGLGPRTERRIERELALLEVDSKGVSLGEALVVGRTLLEQVRAIPGVARAELAGEVRRMKELADRITIVAAAGDCSPVREAFWAIAGQEEGLDDQGDLISIVVGRELKAELRVVPPASFVLAWHALTGSPRHLQELGRWAKERGFAIGEEGILELATGRVHYPETEEELYQLLGLPYIPPELREGLGEVEMAGAGRLPDLTTLEAIRGDLHVHSTWSDGRSTIHEIALAAKEQGYEYIAITDHSQALKIAGGLTRDDLLRQREEIARVKEAVPGVQILAGVEVDILADGSLDLDDEILAELDLVVASIHSGLRQDREKLTQRLVRAIAHPHVDIIGHPTGRLLGERGAADVDIDRVIEAAAEHQTALEINASPQRLDLKDALARRAAEAGVLLAVNTDAHETGQLAFMELGVGVARRAWCTPAQILNAKSWDELLRWLKERRS